MAMNTTNGPTLGEDLSDFGDALSGLGRRAIHLVNGVWPSFQRGIVGAPTDTGTYQPRLANPMDSRIITACIYWIMRKAAEAPIVLSKMDSDGQGEVQPRHPVTDLLRRPNDDYSGRTLMQVNALSYSVAGNSYNVLGLDDANRLRAWWFPPWRVRPVRTQGTDDFISHYVVTDNRGQPVIYPVESVIHFRFGLDPANSMLGISPLRSVMTEAGVDLEATKWMISILANAAAPSSVISPRPQQGGNSNFKDVDRIRNYVREKFTGRFRGGPLVFDTPTEVRPFTYSPGDLRLRDVRRTAEESIPAQFGLNAVAVSLGAGLDRSTYSNYAEAREAAVEECILPLFASFTDTLDTQLLPLFLADPEDYHLDFDISKMRALQEDQDKLTNRVKGLYQVGLISQPTAQMMLDLPVEDVAPPMPNLGIASHPHDHRHDDGFTITDAQRRAIEDEQDVIRKFGTDWDRQTVTQAGNLRRLFDEFGQTCSEAYLDLMLEPGERQVELSDEEIRALADEIMSLAESQEVEDRLGQIWSEGYVRTATATVDSINAVAGLGINIDSINMQRILAAGGSRLGLIDFDGTARESLFRAISEGRAAGDGPATIAEAIADQVPAGKWVNAGSEYRSYMIARTETKWAQNESSLDAFEASEAIQGVRAYDNQTGCDCDPICIARDQQLFTVSEARGQNLAHPNCTLTWAPVVDFTPDRQADLGAEYLQTTTNGVSPMAVRANGHHAQVGHGH